MKGKIKHIIKNKNKRVYVQENNGKTTIFDKTPKIVTLLNAEATIGRVKKFIEIDIANVVLRNVPNLNFFKYFEIIGAKTKTANKQT